MAVIIPIDSPVVFWVTIVDRNGCRDRQRKLIPWAHGAAVEERGGKENPDVYGRRGEAYQDEYRVLPLWSMRLHRWLDECEEPVEAISMTRFQVGWRRGR